MKRLEFRTLINAPKEKVWETLWSEETYPEWTSPFGPGSKMESDDLEQGSKVRFLADGGHGMYSTIEERNGTDYISFKHQGEIKDGKELPIDKDNGWHGALESYTLHESGDVTQLLVEVDMDEKDSAMMESTFPKSLQILKNLSEE